MRARGIYCPIVGKRKRPAWKPRVISLIVLEKPTGWSSQHISIKLICSRLCFILFGTTWKTTCSARTCFYRISQLVCEDSLPTGPHCACLILLWSRLVLSSDFLYCVSNTTDTKAVNLTSLACCFAFTKFPKVSYPILFDYFFPS